MLLFLLGRSEFFIGLLLASVSVCAPDQCPSRIDCARAGRHFCTPGSSQCGPCLPTLQEDKEGNCVRPSVQNSHHSEKTSLPDLDNEIDYLASVIAKNQASDTRRPASSSNLQSKLGESQSASKNESQLTTVQPVTHGPTTSTKQPTSPHESSGRAKPISVAFPRDSMLIILMSACIFLAIVALLLAAVCWVRVQRESHVTEKVDYPVFQVVGSSNPNSNSLGDKNLAQSAQMYHYQHQKQQMLSMEKNKAEPKVPLSRTTSDEENDDGDFTVYECPGLAPTGEMEVKNPLFDDSALYPGRNHK